MTNGHPLEWRGCKAVLEPHGRPGDRALGPFTPWERFACTILSTEGDHHGDIGKASRALREVERRGLRRFTIGVSEDDLRVIAEHGYEGATSTDRDQRAQALSRFITDMLAARRSARNSVAAVATSFH